MAKFGEYAKTGYSGEFEMLEEGWHKVKVTAAEILDQKKWQSELTEKKLKLTFETAEEVNSDGYAFKIFHWVRVEVDPNSDKSKLNQLIVGLYGSVPEDIMDRDIEEDLIGKMAEVLTVNKPNRDGTKTFTEIIKFRQITGKTTVKKSEKTNIDQMFANLSEEQKKAMLLMLAEAPAVTPTVKEKSMSPKELAEAEKEASTPMKDEDFIDTKAASLDLEVIPF